MWKYFFVGYAVLMPGLLLGLVLFLNRKKK